MRSLILGSLLLLSIFTNIYFVFRIWFSTAHSTSPVVVQVDNKKYYSLLASRAFSDEGYDLIMNLVPLRKRLNEYAASWSRVGEKAGFYFEYLPSGVSVGVGEKESYILASLLKVPLAMAVYKEIDEGTLIKDRQLTIKKENIDPMFGDLWKKGEGATITVEDALRLMITESDNTAKSVLFSAISTGRLEEVFDYLDIPKDLQNSQAVVTPKNYASVLKSLYLSTYLPRDLSEELLELLSQSKFDDKLVAGVGPNVPVAHKIGVYDPTDQMHSLYTDCGIVYLTRRPYILCMMVRANEPRAREYMKHISGMIFDYVEHVRPMK